MFPPHFVQFEAGALLAAPELLKAGSRVAAAMRVKSPFSQSALFGFIVLNFPFFDPSRIPRSEFRNSRSAIRNSQSFPLLKVSNSLA